MSPRPNVESERRQQIMEAAMQCFSQQGYHQTSMNDIAAALPLSKGLLYYYFKTKRDLFLAIVDHWMDQAREAWRALLATEEDPLAQMRVCLEYGVQLVTENVTFAQIEFEFYGEIGRDEAVRDSFKSLFADFRVEIEAILEEGIATGVFRAVDARSISAVLLGAYDGLAMQALADPQAFDWKVVSQNLYDMVMSGIAVSALNENE